MPPSLRLEYSAVCISLVLAVSLQVNMLSTTAQSPSVEMPSVNCREMTTGGMSPSLSRTLSTFQKIRPQASVEELFKQVGCPDADIGSGIHIYIYRLTDGSQVWIGTPGKEIFYIDHRRDGELIKRLVGEMPSSR